MRRNILHINGDAHGRLRGLVNPAFTPRAADRWRPAMREFLERLWAPLEGRGGCEFVADFAKPYPSLTIATVMGAPLEDAPKLHEWSNLIQGQFDPHVLTNELERVERACAEFYEWAGALIERRKGDPGDDLISTLIAAEQEGDRLSDVECMNLVLNVLVGGVDTTQSQLRAACERSRRTISGELLAARPELAPRAVEELLRYEPITPFTARLLHEEVEYRDVVFPADTVVMVCSFAANRDGVEGEPGAFDITAERGSAKPLTFGAGIHYAWGRSGARRAPGSARVPARPDARAGARRRARAGLDPRHLRARPAGLHVELGLFIFPTEYTIQPAGWRGSRRNAASRACSSPSTPIPAARDTPYPAGGELPREYSHTYDPFAWRSWRPRPPSGSGGHRRLPRDGARPDRDRQGGCLARRALGRRFLLESRGLEPGGDGEPRHRPAPALLDPARAGGGDEGDLDRGRGLVRGRARVVRAHLVVAEAGAGATPR